MSSFLRAYRVAGNVYTHRDWHCDALSKAIYAISLETGRSIAEVQSDVDSDVIDSEHGFVIDGEFLTDYEYDQRREKRYA
jgi:hypothetical protein